MNPRNQYQFISWLDRQRLQDQQKREFRLFVTSRKASKKPKRGKR